MNTLSQTIFTIRKNYIKNIAKNIVLLVSLAFTGTSFGQSDRYWSGSGANDDISTTGNWYGGVNPNPDDNLYFNNTAGGHVARCNYATNNYFTNIISYNGAGGIKITGHNIYAYKFENTSDPVLLEISPSIEALGSRELGNRLGNDIEINPVGSGGILISCDKVSIDNQGGVRILKVYGTNTLTINAAIYEKNGTGAKFQLINSATVILKGQNTYTGLTTLDAGTLHLNRIGGETLASGNDVVVNSGATLKVSYNQTLNKITLNGGTIDIDTGVTLSVNNIETTVGTITGSGELKIIDVLTVNTGTFTTNNNVTLVSTASNTARVAPVTGTISGNVTVERYIPAKRAYRLIGTPLKGTSNNTIAANWQSTAGEGVLLFSPATYLSQTMTGYTTGGDRPNIFKYGTAWQSIPNVATETLFGATATDANAYQVFVTGASDSGNLMSGSSATTLKPKGTLITGTVTHSLAASTYKLLANPYASALNTEALITANSGSKAWLLDPSTGYGTYIVYDGNNWSSPVSGSNKNIQSGQGFFVKSTAAMDFNISESNKVSGSSNNWFDRSASTTSDDKIRVLLHKQEGADYVLADAILAVNSANGNTMVDGADADKISNFSDNIMFRNGTSNLSIEYRALPLVNETQPIRLTGTSANNYQLRLYVENYSNSSLVPMLEDTQAGTFTSIPTDGSTVIIPFNGVVSTSTNPDNRFRIVYQSALSNNTFSGLQVSVYPNPVNGGNLNINLSETGLASYSMYNVIGQQVAQGKLSEQSNQVNVSQLQAGVYVLNVEQLGNKYSRKVVIK